MSSRKKRLASRKRRLKDHVKFSKAEELQANLSLIASQLRTASKSLYKQSNLCHEFRVYSAIADATAEQLDLLGRLLREPIEITANVCRTIFEINVVFRYCLLSQDKLNNYETQAATDEISIYKSIKKLSDEDTDPNTLKTINGHIEHIRNVLQRHGKSSKTEHSSTYQMAKAVGLEKEYDALYGIYSKYIHASAWFVLRKREHIDLPMFRNTMQINTQLYAEDTLKHIEDILSNTA